MAFRAVSCIWVPTVNKICINTVLQTKDDSHRILPLKHDWDD